MKPLHCKLSIALVILLFTSCVDLKAQSRFRVMLDYHYMLGLSQKIPNYTITRSESKMYGNSLRLTALYAVIDKLSVGVGVGADHYDKPDYNTFPVFATVHYRPLFEKLPAAYLYTNIGYAVIDTDNVTPGFVGDVGVGYTKMFRRHFGLNFQLGYNLKQFADTPFSSNGDVGHVETKHSTRHSISFGLGLVF